MDQQNMNLEAKLYKYQAHMLQRELPIYEFLVCFIQNQT